MDCVVHGVAKNQVQLSDFHTGDPVGKESTCNAGDPGLTPELGRSPGEGKGYPLQCSGLDSSMDCIVCGVTKSQTRLRNFHFHGYQRERGAVGEEKLVAWD